MEHKVSKTALILIPWYILILMFVTILFTPFSCNNKKPYHPEEGNTIPLDSAKISWNILFKPGTDSIARAKIIDNIIEYVFNFYDAKNIEPKFTMPVSCPCDTLLYNIGFTPIDGSGQSVTTSPTKPGPKASGDELDAVISDNIPINEFVREMDSGNTKTYNNNYGRTNNAGIGVSINSSVPVDLTKKLAIIDSGIDTTGFSPAMQHMIWSDNVQPTLYNFLPGHFNEGFSDLTHGKHGTAVASIIINTLKNATKYPRIMILKALDENKKGSIFSVSCALSYAIQNKADLINLSLGYYGTPDSILHHYLGLSNSANPSIPVFAAAGNTTDTPHVPSNLCNQIDNHNRLGGSRLFYPACFSADLSNITSVTQMSNENLPCFYQNYSSHFIQLGVLIKTTCCAIAVGSKIYEGSSFATPVASGLRMGTLLQAPDPNTADTNWNALINTSPSNTATEKGKYLEYTP